MTEFVGNNCTGEIHIVLDTSDAGDSPTGKTNDLKVWIGGPHMGEDDEPTVWITVNDSRDRYERVTDGENDCMFSVSVKRLRNILDMIDAMERVGDDQWEKQ